jgi:hypothetical protein
MDDDKLYVVMALVFISMILFALLGGGSSGDPRCDKWKGKPKSYLACMGGNANADRNR